MAADLVRSSDIQHTFIQDLESFFWVLIWIVVTQVKSSWDDEMRTEFLEVTMRPKFYDQNRGKENAMSSRCHIQSGGTTKETFLTSTQLTDGKFDIPGNPTLRDFLIALKRIVAIRYNRPVKFRPSFGGDKDYGSKLFDFDYENKLKTHQALEDEYFKDHSGILHQFQMAVAAEWPDNDEAEAQNVLQPRSTTLYGRSSAKRSWSVVEGGDDSESSNKRKG
jgi:Fungal protein kinase